MYRGLLKYVAKVWNPADIRDTGLLEKVLTAMQSAIVILYGMAKKDRRFRQYRELSRIIDSQGWL